VFTFNVQRSFSEKQESVIRVSLDGTNAKTRRDPEGNACLANWGLVVSITGGIHAGGIRLKGITPRGAGLEAGIN